MADEADTVNSNEKTPTSVDGIIKAVTAEFEKQKVGPFKEKLKAIMAKRLEHQKAIKLLDAEEADLIAKYKSGVL